MKIRVGFVSNSSSSSFLCGVCGEHDTVETGDNEWEYKTLFATFAGDICGEDFDRFLRDKGLEKQFAHFLETLKEEHGDGWKWEIFNELTLCEEFCPYQCLHYIRDKELLQYMFCRFGVKRERMEAEIRDRFRDLPALKKYLESYK